MKSFFEGQFSHKFVNLLKQVDGFVLEMTFEQQLYKHFVWDTRWLASSHLAWTIHDWSKELLEYPFVVWHHNYWLQAVADKGSWLRWNVVAWSEVGGQHKCREWVAGPFTLKELSFRDTW